MLLIEENGVPLSFGVDGANRHDSKLLDLLLYDRFQSFEPLRYAFNLCLDAGFVGKDEVGTNHGFIPHICGRGEEKQVLKRDPDFRAKRWVVEAINSWRYQAHMRLQLQHVSGVSAVQRT